jgi:hypothetical protein
MSYCKRLDAVASLRPHRKEECMASRRDAPRTKGEASVTSESASTVLPADSTAKRRTTPLPKRAAPTGSQADSSSRTGSGTTENAVQSKVEVSNEARYRMICEAAYIRAEQRGFRPGGEVEDWLAAEQEVERLLAAEHVPTSQ